MKSGIRIIWRWTPGRLRKPGMTRCFRRRLALLPVLALTAMPVWAQLSQVNTLLTTIETTLLSVGAVVCSISIIWAGFKMMFQHARFGDIANVFIGGLFVGCATVIAAMLIPTS
ncbi:type IV secretion system protein VirB2 [Paraburkholderia silvatlantica]|uniref:Type IV secretion system protein VirB2 n=2 Tax=Paraburkholderia silvatlantica TaxID=321895 RepID=A0A2V4UFT8_9BURK|nr:type IV secretion system protein VirB2 [Paraburkholderia silvatlantica]TDQ81143.1 type IV secretion system protein VirB2 [Paraburkholderia silvatlantica]